MCEERPTMKKVTAIVIGAGARGKTYSSYALMHPDKLQIAAVAAPPSSSRSKFQTDHGLAENTVFDTWEDIVKCDKMADCAFITTLDRMHKDPAVALASKGYHILLEKPMAVSYEDCEEIVESCDTNNIMLAVCHVLRYSPQAITIKRLIEQGVIGDIMNIQHLEPIGFWHDAHSFVRGKWRKEQDTSPSLLAKCSHDLDLIQYWMGDLKCQRVSSFGSLKHFNRTNKPEDAGDRCLDCPCEQSCPYSAKKIYLEPATKGKKDWPINVICKTIDIENVTEALRTGPYGRCVYECDNDVMDNQVVIMHYEGGATCSMTMVACTELVCQRQVRLFGSKGELTCDFQTNVVREYNFLTREAINHDVMTGLGADDEAVSFGQSDYSIMKAFVEAVAMNDKSKIRTGPEESLRSHQLCFAAETARIENRIVEI